MTKLINLLLVFLLCFENLCSQDLFNPYIMRDSPPYNSTVNLISLEPLSTFLYDSELPYVSSSSGYDGEYMISLKYHPWHGHELSPALSYYYGLQDNYKSYSIELVSFPFMINCFDDINGCSPPNGPLSLFERELSMPDAMHQYIGEKWGNLFQSHTEGTFRYSDGMSSQDSPQCPDRLVSRLFKSDGSVSSSCATTLPHSILKHTVNLHCGSTINDPIISSFSWVYDNTRGVMRFYPFYDNNDNSISAQAGQHDVMFVPTLVQDNTYEDPNGTLLLVNRYDRQDNFNLTNGGLISGGTINYFPFDEIEGCLSFPIPQYTYDEFSMYDPLLITYYPYFNYNNGGVKPYPSSFLLMNNFLRNANGETMAGYTINGNLLSPIQNPGFRLPLSFYIDRDFDNNLNGVVNLNIINSVEKIIYNPSEVTLDPDAGDPAQNNPPIEVIFPEGYTFKTVLGRYPSVQQVEDANNDPQNGGYYSDLRQVPVPVNAADLTPVPDPVNYPEVMWNDPTTLIDDRYGYYYIEDKATLTVERCVKIFDAIFKVNEGGTLRFNHYPGILGFEDTHSNDGRYKIIGNFGAVLRNYKQVQYVQNGNITQTLPLDYIATEQIIAGKNVDIDNDQGQGDYKILPGADVTFTAGVYIHLQDGFSVQGGDFHAVIDENMYVPLFCDQSTSQGGNRISNQEQQVINSNERNGLVISPNPNTGSFKIELNDEVLISSINIYDAIGKQVFFKSEINLSNYALTLSSEIKGILIVKTTHSNGTVTSSKIAVH